MKLIKRNQGFTLIEALITSLIFSFVLAGVGSFMIINAKLSQKGINEAFLQSNLNLILKKMSIDVKNGYSLVITSPHKVEIKGKTGILNTWIYDSKLKKLNRNGISANPIGLNINYDCKFTKKGDSTVQIELKLKSSDSSTENSVTTGNDYLVYYYSCRNILDANVGM